jgi:hypothetical protein
VRDRVRRGRLASTLLFGLLLVGVGAVFVGLSDPDHTDGPLPGLFYLLPWAFGAGLLAAILNRRGWVNAAGVLMVAIADLPLLTIALYTHATQLDVVHLTGFYPIAVAVLFAASILPPWSVFLVAVFNSIIVCAIILLEPHAAAFAATFDDPADIIGTMGQPMGLELVTAIVAYLWTTSTLRTMHRADHAEALAAAERREVERTRELEEGVQQLLAVHVAIANGHFAARVPPVRNPQLWQIGGSLNNLIGRFARLAQAEHLLQRTHQEAERLAQAIHAWRTGRPPLWPSPTGTPLDPVVMALAGEAHIAASSQAGPIAQPLAGRVPPPTPSTAEQMVAPPVSPRRTTARLRPAPDTTAELPEWLQPAPQLDRPPTAPNPSPWRPTDQPGEFAPADDEWPDLSSRDDAP